MIARLSPIAYSFRQVGAETPTTDTSYRFANL
uniref:Uncharacterized protein n=1 Tax=Arundo donax TaxID=35708 RepID=A0A0A8YQB5_ARUDO